MKQNIRCQGLALAFLLWGAGVRAQVTEFHPGVVSGGVTYALPKTVFRVQAEAVRTEHVPGEFARYAERCLHLQNVSQERSVRYEMKRVRMVADGVPDTDKVFTVAYNPKTTAPLVRLSPQGVLWSVNSDETVEAPSLPPADRIRTSHALDARRYLTEEILSAASTVKMAELTAAEIYDLRESRNALLRGEADNQPKDGEALRLRLTGLQEQEDALLQLFLGYTDTVSVVQVYTVRPEEADAARPLFRFSSRFGFVDADDLSGEPYRMTVTDRHTVQLPDAKELQKRKLTGLVYNLPGTAAVTLEGEGRRWLDLTVPVAQFGTDDQLARSLFEKNATTRVTFCPSTGGILHISK